MLLDRDRLMGEGRSASKTRVDEGTPHPLSRSSCEAVSCRGLCVGRQPDGRYGAGGPTRELRIIERSGSQHGDQRTQEPIGDTSEGAAVRVTAPPVFGIGRSAVFIVLHANKRPVIDRAPETIVTGVTHHDLFAFPALAGHRSDAGVGTQGVIITIGQELGCFGEHRGR